MMTKILIIVSELTSGGCKDKNIDFSTVLKIKRYRKRYVNVHLIRNSYALHVACEIFRGSDGVNPETGFGGPWPTCVTVQRLQ